MRSLQKAETYLEPKQASTMEFFVNIINSLLFSQEKLHHRCSTGLLLLLFLYLTLTKKKKVKIQLKSLNLQYIKLPKR